MAEVASVREVRAQAEVDPGRQARIHGCAELGDASAGVAAEAEMGVLAERRDKEARLQIAALSQESAQPGARLREDEAGLVNPLIVTSRQDDHGEAAPQAALEGERTEPVGRAEGARRSDADPGAERPVARRVERLALRAPGRPQEHHQ